MVSIPAAAAPQARSLADARFIGDVMGSYVLLSRSRNEGGVKVFACRARSISAQGAVVHAPVSGALGEGVTVNFADLGIFSGQVTRILDGGFAMSFQCTEEERAGLAARVDWLQRRKLKAVSDRRVHKRVLPRETRARLIFGDSRKVECMLIDMSQSGVAVSADVLPKLGAVVAVGSVPGQVVRHLEAGFAVQFVELQKLDTLEGRLTLRTSEDRAIAAADLGFAATG